MNIKHLLAAALMLPTLAQAQSAGTITNDGISANKEKMRQSPHRLFFKAECNDALTGLIDFKGNVIIKNEYSRLEERDYNLPDVRNYSRPKVKYIIIGKKPHKKGLTLFSADGILLKENIDEVKLFSPNFFILQQLTPKGDGKWGIFDNKGRQITKYLYDKDIDINTVPDHVIAMKNSDYVLVDTLGHELFLNKNEEEFKKQVETFKEEKNIYPYVIAESYEITTPIIFKDERTSKYGIVEGGDTLIKPIYDYAYINYTLPCLVVKTNSKYGIISFSGKTLLPPIFDEIGYICNSDSSLVIAVFEGKYGVYNLKTGDTVIQPTYGYLNFTDFY